MRAQVPPAAAVPKNNPPAVALRPLDAEPVPPLGPKEPAAVFPDAPPPAAPGHRDTSAAGDQVGGGMMGNFGGGISPGSLEGISRLRLCMYVMGAMAVLLLLFAVYAYAMFDDSGEPRAVPGVDAASGLGGNGMQCWNYGDDATWLWPEYQCIANNSCGGKQQSPVNIETFGVLHDIALKALEFEGHDVPFENFTVTNDGLSLTLKASPLDTTSRTVQGGRLPGTFVFQRALFHWGSGSGQGSEHHIDGVAYPMEVQMVYTNKKYSAEVAATEKDGVAIIATLYRATFVDFDSVKAMRAVVAAVNSSAPRKRHRRRLLPWMARRLRVGRHGASGESDDNPPRLTLDSLLPSVGRSEYFTYRGSLTTPPCTESVRWTVFTRQAFISETVLQKFRSLKDYTGAKPLVDNFRPPQKLNGRKIISSFAPF